MNSPEKALLLICERFGFIEPVPADVLNAARNNKKNSAKAVLISQGRYSLFFSLVFNLYYGVKKYGFRLTMAQCRKAVAFLTVMLAASLATGGLFTYSSFIKIPGIPCTLAYASGDVTVTSHGKVIPFTKGYELTEHDSIRTGVQSTVYIDTGSGTIIKVSPRTVFNIALIKDTRRDGSAREFIVEQGRIAAFAKKLKKDDSTVIKTPTLVVAIRGTLFAVSYDGSESRAAVNEGKVEAATADGSIKSFVNAGEALRTAKNILTADAITADEDREMKECAAVAEALARKAGDDEIDTILKNYMEEIKAAGITLPAEKDTKPLEPIENVGYRVGVLPFTGDGIDRDIREEITDLVAEGISEDKGEKHVINLRKHSSRKKNANRLLTGSVEALGSGFLISARMIDAETSKVLFAFSETAASKKDITVAAGKIAKGAGAKLK